MPISVLWPIGIGSATLLGYAGYHAIWGKKEEETPSLPPPAPSPPAPSPTTTAPPHLRGPGRRLRLPGVSPGLSDALTPSFDEAVPPPSGRHPSGRRQHWPPHILQDRPPAGLPVQDTNVQAMIRRFTHLGPRGELVFNPETAQTIQNALRSMIVTHPRSNDPGFVQIHPESTGLPPAPSLSAAHWMVTQNQRMSVLAPVHLAVPTGAEKFLRLSSPGHESELAPHGYAVLSYAGTHRPLAPAPQPGLAPRPQPPRASAPGHPPLTRQKTQPIPTPASQAASQVPPALLPDFNQILQQPVAPPVVADLAAQFHQAGLPAAAAVLADKATNQARGTPAPAARPTPSAPTYTPPPAPVSISSHAEKATGGVEVTRTPKGWVIPVSAAQNLLIVTNMLSPTQANGKPSNDGIRGHDTDLAVRLFQNKAGIQPVTGIVDATTAASLKTAADVIKSTAAVSGAAPARLLPGWSVSVREAQQALVTLNRLGFFQVSGVPDVVTRTALADFQRANGLSATGIADGSTTRLLLGASGIDVAVGSWPQHPGTRALIRARRGLPSARSGAPFYQGQDIPLEAIYGTYPMNRYAKVWGYWPWP
jgi:peptidoglycan hydrolase-like protein with peptidoglycan-binding domain